MLTLKQLLDTQSTVLEGKRVKLVRHKDNRAQYREVVKDRKKLLAYQKEQGRDVFADCDYIVSFIGLERGRSLFFGVFKVLGGRFVRGHYVYDLEQVPDFNPLVDRLVIDWGASARAWLQWYHRQPKTVIEILPEGYIGNFPGLLDFVLEFDELETLIRNPEANHDWKHHLSAVNGVYLILDRKTGKQYVGSAYGDEGIWGRWKNYVATGHGHNKELKKLLAEDLAYHRRHFVYSILQTLPSNVSARESIEIEALYKRKLGVRVHGLNAN